jgi:predicted phage tail protein
MIYLHGILNTKYGKCFDLEVRDAAEAVRALSAHFPEFRSDLVKGHWHIKNGNVFLSESLLHLGLGNNDLHIIPAVEGAKDKGLGKIVAGIALVALSFALPSFGVIKLGTLGAAGALGPGASVFAFSNATLAGLGAAVALGGVASLLSPIPTVDNYESAEETVERNGPLRGQGNTTQIGQAIPLVYGRMRIGSHLISVELDNETLSIAEATEPLKTKFISITAEDYTLGSGSTLTGYHSRVTRLPGIIGGITLTAYSIEFGSASPALYRSRNIAQIIQTLEGSFYYLSVVFQGQTDARYTWLKEVEVLDASGNPLGSPINLSVADAGCKFTTGNLEYYNRDDETIINSYSTRWKWPVGVFPFFSSGTDYQIALKYG